MKVGKVSASDFLSLFAGQADLVSKPVSPAIWRERAEDLAAFLAAHDQTLSPASFEMMLHIGGMLWLMTERESGA